MKVEIISAANGNPYLFLSAWNEKHWLKPDLFEQPELMQVKLVLTIETKEAGDNGIKGGIKVLTREGSRKEGRWVIVDKKDDGNV